MLDLLSYPTTGSVCRRTALRIHLDQKRRDCHFPDWNGHVKEENRDPGEEKEVVHFTCMHNDVHVVSEAMENSQDPKDLGQDCESL